MNAKELLYNSQKFYVESEHGDNSLIQYIYSDNTTVSDLKVFTDHSRNNELQKEANFSSCLLTNVILPKIPEQNDTVRITGDTRIWKVQSWRYSSGMYILDITAARRRV